VPDLLAAVANDRRADPFYAILGLQDHVHGIGKRQRARIFIPAPVEAIGAGCGASPGRGLVARWSIGPAGAPLRNKRDGDCSTRGSDLVSPESLAKTPSLCPGMDDCIRILKAVALARDQIVAFLVGNEKDTWRRIDLADHLSAIDN
jgi:hypothetical protein